MIALLAGGVGAARLLGGLVRTVDPGEIDVVVNVGDDEIVHGLSISPDLDTITYGLAGVTNTVTGWGIENESFVVMDELARFSDATWFRLGDRDLATHLYRTGRLREGATLSEVTSEIAKSWGIVVRVHPMSDDPVRTKLQLVDGRSVDFQEYFVYLHHDVAVTAVDFAGSSGARPGPKVIEVLEQADKIVIAPSNPIVSIGPILAIEPIRAVLERRRERVVAISPIVEGAAIKGPAARLLQELGHESSAFGVARLLRSVVGAFVIDERDREQKSNIEGLEMSCAMTETMMENDEIAANICRVALDLLDQPFIVRTR